MELDNGRPVRSRQRDLGRGERWQGDATASYPRGTEKNGVQRSVELTVTVRL
jgi:hypothetical protein